MKNNRYGCQFNLLKKLKNDVIDSNNDKKLPPHGQPKIDLKFELSLSPKVIFKKISEILAHLTKISQQINILRNIFHLIFYGFSILKWKKTGKFKKFKLVIHFEISAGLLAEWQQLQCVCVCAQAAMAALDRIFFNSSTQVNGGIKSVFL